MLSFNFKSINWNRLVATYRKVKFTYHQWQRNYTSLNLIIIVVFQCLQNNSSVRPTLNGPRSELWTEILKGIPSGVNSSKNKFSFLASTNEELALTSAAISDKSSSILDFLTFQKFSEKLISTYYGIIFMISLKFYKRWVIVMHE